ncbi:hypothetical protein ABC382_00100 [Lysinibacillus sp. 1P01SD]|uniref:hypothetical protein n=1 Tax=Lysinibacillus sp. 1P01SD TaxID=3132285 RepID=UPI00399EF41E
MWNEVKSQYRQIKEGLYVIANKELVNGDIVIPKGTGGKIVHAQNQVSADIWFYDNSKYQKHLKVETDHFKSTQFRGVVLTLKGTDFAIKYKHEEHSEMTFDEEQLATIPYLDLTQLPSQEGRRYNGNEKILEFKLTDIVDSIESDFSVFVNKLEQRPSTEDDSGDLDYVFTDDSIELFEIEREKILEPFIKTTGIYYNFLGGAIYD